MHSPRPSIRGRDPHRPSPSGGGRRGEGGRHRRRSPPAPPSPGYQRRTPPPRRPHPDVSAAAHHHHILLEAGRLAAHYLVAQGVIPEHVLRAREDPPAPRDDGGDPRSRRNDGDWARAWEDDDRQARKSTRWGRRSHSFDDRRKYHDAGHDAGRARRTRDYDEPRRPPMSRSYSHNDRRPSADADPRSRSRSRTRSYYVGSGSGSSSSSSSSRDLDHIIPAADVHYRQRRQRRVPSSVVVADSGDQEGGEIHGLNPTRDISEAEDGEFEQGISEDEDGEFAAARLNAENAVEMDVTQHPLSDFGTNVHLLESVEETVVHRGSQSQPSNAIEHREAANAPMVMDACTRETLGEDNECSRARDEVVAPHPQRRGEARADNFINRDKPASRRVFDLNVVETPDACEITDISGDAQADHVSDSVPDLVGRIHQQTICHASEIQGQDERAGDTHNMLKNDLIRYDLNSEAVEDAHDIHLLENEKLLPSHSIDAHDTTRIRRSNVHLHLNHNADELEHDNNWTENHTVIGEQLLLSDGMDGHPVHNNRMASESKSLPTGVYDLHSYNLKSEKMLLNDGADKHAHDSCRLKDGQKLFSQSANRQARIHNRANERTIPVINLEDDDYEGESDIREFFESKSYQFLGVGPAIL